MKWELEEEVLLVDLYYQISSLSSEKLEVKIENISSLLRKRALSLGADIDETFRNIPGIKMKLQNISFVVTGGKNGLSSYSKMDKETVVMYKERRSEFDKILVETMDRYMNNKTIFLEWLTHVEKSKIPNSIFDTLLEVDEYALKTKKTVNSLWEIYTVKECNKLMTWLSADKFFRIKNKLKGNYYTFALNCYINFLKWNSTSNIKFFNRKNFEIDSAYVKVAQKENYINLTEKIKELLKEAPVIKFSVTQICDYLKDVCRREEIKNILQNVPWAIETKSGCYKFNDITVENNFDNEAESIQFALRTVDFKNENNSYAFTKPTMLKIHEIKISVKNWTDLYIKLCNYLANNNMEIMNSLVKEIPLVTTATRVYFNRDGKNLVAPKQLNNGIWAETNFSANDIILNADRLLVRFGIPHKYVSISYLINDTKTIEHKIPENTSFDFTLSSMQLVQSSNSWDNFYNWMLQIKKMSVSSANSYSSAVKICGEYAIKQGITSHTLFEIEDWEQIRNIIVKLHENEEFANNNDMQQNRFSSALKKFYEFAVRDNESPILFDGYKPIMSKAEPMSYSEYGKVLLEKFPRGFKKGSSIDAKRFRRFYEEIFEKELLDDDDKIQKTIKEVGIEYEDSRVMSPQNAVNEEILVTIFDYIDDCFNSGKTMIYYKSIYEQFEQELLTTNVYNDKILKQVLIYFSKGRYCLKRSFIVSSPNIEADPAEEIKEVLVSNILPMSCEEIEAEIPHIPLSKLKFVMAQKPEFVNTERNYYTHIDCIYFNSSDIEVTNNIIDEGIRKNGFITRTDVIKNLKLDDSHIVEKNSTLTVLGLGNAIAFHCRENHDCNGRIFSSKGLNLNAGTIFSNYCMNKTIVKIEELEYVAKQLGFTSLPGIYLGEVFLEFARIDRKTLVRKNSLIFNSELIDSILDKFCVGDYIALSEVNTFALFPSSEYTWNSFLLESYVKDYSVTYKYLGDSISMSKCIGAVVKKKSKFTDYEQILIDVFSLSQGKCLMDKKEALNYLYEKGFIAKRRMSNIDTLTSSAKIIREKRGK